MSLPPTQAIACAKGVWSDVLCVANDERALAVCDEDALEVACAFHLGARDLGIACGLLVIPRISTETGEPMAAVQGALSHVDAYVGVTSAGAKSLTHTRARRAASSAGARGLTLPGFTSEMLLRSAVAADYRAIARATEGLASHLTGSSEIHVVSEGGTDLRLDVHGGEWFAERGLCDQPSQFSNLPGGEVSIAPVNTNGVLVVDGSISWVGRLESPLRIEISDNHITNITGQAADRLRAALDPFGASAYSVAEIGIGMNPDAVLCGDVLEDEKILGSIHIGFGDNSNMGGRSLARVVEAPIHGDGVVVSNPRLFADGSRVDPRAWFKT